MTIPDRIEREITIEAPVARVWALVTEPGWWIGDTDEDWPRQRHSQGDLEIIDHPRYGRFPVSVETVDPQRHVAFRWASTFPGQDPVEGNSTIVEFWLSEREEGGTLVRVVESGFASLDAPEEVRDQSYEGNVKGWEQELGFLKRHAQA
jgi:uncharacterized protein YndB with AHSA1/START domain